MNYLSLFSGIEAASAAWRPLGWAPLALAEVAPFPCAVLSVRFPGVPNLGDVRSVDWGAFVAVSGRPDVLVGGSPCQSFSAAGRREGMAGASGLMLELVRAVQETVPRWVVWENVPGALTSERGEAFRFLLSSLDALGYGVAWRVLDAQFFGLAQRRERLFAVGRLGSAPPAEVLFDADGLPWNPAESREVRAELARAAGGGRQGAGDGVLTVWSAGDGQGNAAFEEGVTACLTAHNRKAPPVVAIIERRDGRVVPSVRRLTPEECERLQGFPSGWTQVPYRGRPAAECPDGPRYEAVGNSMAVPVMRWIGERIEREERSCHTRTTSAG